MMSLTNPSFSKASPALTLDVHAQVGEARACTMYLPHGAVRTPVFMPVGTKGTIKGMSSAQIVQESALNCEIILGNTYHLALEPGTGLMVSLLKLAEITEEGADGIGAGCQNEIGADIIMQLDDVVSSVNPDEERFREATERSVRWLDSHGGMREYCIKEMVNRDLPGYAIGGLAGGEDKDRFWRVVAHNAKRLPKNKPRYLMGVGYPLDLVVCVALGVDMFDCVYPTRTARFGVALTQEGALRLKTSQFSSDLKPVGGIDVYGASKCECSTCKNYSRAALHSMFKDSSPLGAQLLTTHNIAYLMHLMRSMRESILQGTSAHREFILNFLQDYFPAGDVPIWVVDALGSVDIKVETSVQR
eukprot:GSChrysophyteH1.ASY1.ANO1.1459.1 assembled CDS